MRIAMVVHNDVQKDARVIKEAATLSSAGHTVTVYGLTTEPEESHFAIEGGNIDVKLTHRTPVASEPEILLGLVKKNSAECQKVARSFQKFMRMKNGDEATRIRRSFTHQGVLLARAVLNDTKPDIVHIHDHIALTAAPVYKSFLNVPIIWDAHEIYQDFAGTDDHRKRANAQIIGDNSQFVDGFITISDSFSKFYAKEYPELPQATIVPNASLLRDMPPYDGRLHDAAALDRDRKIILFQGGLARHRGLEALVKAAPTLNDDWAIVLMGWGPLKESLEAIAEEQGRTSGHGGKVIFLPGVPQEELPFWTAGGTLGVIPYENTGLNHLFCTPNKLWEFPLAGVPILATDLVEMGNTIRQFGTGVLLPRNFSSSDISNQVNSLSDEKLEIMRQACIVFSRTSNWETYSHRLLQVYNSRYAIDSSSWKSKLAAYQPFGDLETTRIDPPSKENGAHSQTAGAKADEKSKRSAKSKGSILTRFVTRLGFDGRKGDLAQCRDELNTVRVRLNSQLEGNQILRAKLDEYARKLESVRNDLRSSKNYSKVLLGRIEELKRSNKEIRTAYRNARKDNRGISPLLHNTVEGMDNFFSKNDAEEPYILFGAALQALVERNNVEFDGMHVLDVGVGPGLMLKRLLEGSQPASVTGLDFSAVAIRKARSNLPNGNFYVSDLYQTLRQQGDIVLCTEVLEHLSDPDLALSNIFSSVLPGGKLVLTVPDGRIDFSNLHINFWSPESWQSFIQRHAKGRPSTVGQFRVSETSSYENNFAIVYF